MNILSWIEKCLKIGFSHHVSYHQDTGANCNHIMLCIKILEFGKDTHCAVQTLYGDVCCLLSVRKLSVSSHFKYSLGVPSTNNLSKKSYFVITFSHQTTKVLDTGIIRLN